MLTQITSIVYVFYCDKQTQASMMYYSALVITHWANTEYQFRQWGCCVMFIVEHKLKAY